MLIAIILISCSISPALAAVCCKCIGPRRIERSAKPLTLIASGFLITLAASHLLPEAMEQGDPHDLGFAFVCCILVLTLFEMLFSANHNPCSQNHKIFKNGAAGILSGSLLHTFCDGLVIASSYLGGMHIGLAVTIAVLSHEIAHELGDYAVMIECGMNTNQAFCVNVTALIGCVSGGVLGYFILRAVEGLLPYALSLSAASFMYVALSDLLPRFRPSNNKTEMIKKFLLLLIGVAISFIIAGHD